jgi:hypothetical protein
MAPKKKEVKDEKPILGRFSSHLKVRSNVAASPSLGGETLQQISASHVERTSDQSSHLDACDMGVNMFRGYRARASAPQ